MAPCVAHREKLPPASLPVQSTSLAWVRWRGPSLPRPAFLSRDSNSVSQSRHAKGALAWLGWGVGLHFSSFDFVTLLGSAVIVLTAIPVQR